MRRLFEGGWPWVWTKRICFGAGMKTDLGGVLMTLAIAIHARRTIEEEKKGADELRAGPRQCGGGCD